MEGKKGYWYSLTQKKLDGKEYHNPSKAFMKNVLCHTNSNLF